MGINYKSSLRILGGILMVLGFAMTLPVIVSLMYHEHNCTRALALVFVPCLLIGFLLMRFINPTSYKLTFRDGAFIVSISWFMCSLIGAVPFILTDSIPNFIDAFFETVSGFTTTGATILDNIEAMPKTMLFWRSFTQWLGGMGILQFAIVLVPVLGLTGNQLASAEVPGPTLSKLTPKLTDSAKYLYTLYLSFTLIETFLLMFGGMNLFDALCHSFSTMGTGGFSNYNNSIAHFDSFYIEFIIMIFMFLAGMNFNLFFISIRNGVKSIIKDGEWKIYVTIIAVSFFAIFINLITSNQYDFFEAIRVTLFQNISILTTTGFTTTDYGLWPYFAQMCLFMLLFVGGCTSSTSGGMKCMRVMVLLKLAKRNLSIRLHPSAVIQVRVNNKILSKDTVSNITNFAFSYLGIGMLLGFLISFDGQDFSTTVSSVFACLGNVGQGFTGLGPTNNFNIFSDISKLIFSLAMIAGRLEIFTLLMLLSRKFWNPHH